MKTFLGVTIAFLLFATFGILTEVLFDCEGWIRNLRYAPLFIAGQIYTWFRTELDKRFK